jgi:fructose-1,6-bisphosphatase
MEIKMKNTQSYCDLCFANFEDCSCKPLTTEEKKVINKFVDSVQDSEWIEVPSPFKAYPPSEGV